MAELSKLERLRQEVAELDRQLLEIAARRNRVVEQIADVKAEGNSNTFFDRDRERFVFQ